MAHIGCNEPLQGPPVLANWPLLHCVYSSLVCPASIGCTLRTTLTYMNWLTLAGSMSGILAALTAAIAFTAIKFVPKSEPTVVLAMWFHCSALATAVVPLAVRLLGMNCVRW